VIDDASLQEYLRRLERELERRGLGSRDTLAEMESHLLDSIDSGLAQGLSLPEARSRALQRFGSPRRIAAQFENERKHPMQKVYFAIALLLGFGIMFVDSQPHWDDTGITVFALLSSAGLIALLAGKRPWLIALAVGLWIPAQAIIVRHDFAMLITLLFPLVGAYAGWAVRRFIPKLSHSA
jgi:hypothetical protein